MIMPCEKESESSPLLSIFPRIQENIYRKYLHRSGKREDKIPILKKNSTNPINFSMDPLKTLYIPDHCFDRPTETIKLLD